VSWSWLIPVVQTLVPVAALAVAGWIAKLIKQPSDRERADLLSIISNAAAAYVVSLNPNAAWADLVRDVIQSISASAGLPTKNVQAIEREAVAALVRLGIAPNASK
jgi:hypothetical protein